MQPVFINISIMNKVKLANMELNIVTMMWNIKVNIHLANGIKLSTCYNMLEKRIELVNEIR